MDRRALISIFHCLQIWATFSERMLLLARRIGYTSDMNRDRDTFQPLADLQPDPGGSPEDAFPHHSTYPPPFSPPPPSAPSEFLTAQWMPPAPASAEVPRPAFALPPPSAPGEFLSAQWLESAASNPESHQPETDVFADALPETVQNAGDLERLASDTPRFDGSLPLSEEKPGDACDDTPVRIRGVPLASGEEIVQVFLPNEGLSASVPASGQAMILTSRRLIAFRGVEGFRDTHFALTSEISQCSVRTGQRNWGAILQGLMIMVGGAFLYLAVGYWLAGRVSGPNVPVLNIDVAPLIALLIVLAGLLVLMQNYFTRPAGAVIFHGEGVEIAFPFRSSLDLSQVYEFVNEAHAARRRADSEMP